MVITPAKEIVQRAEVRFAGVLVPDVSGEELKEPPSPAVAGVGDNPGEPFQPQAGQSALLGDGDSRGHVSFSSRMVATSWEECRT